MKKLTQAEFDVMICARDERGYITIPDDTECTEIDFRGADVKNLIQIAPTIDAELVRTAD